MVMEDYPPPTASDPPAKTHLNNSDEHLSCCGAAHVSVSGVALPSENTEYHFISAGFVSRTRAEPGYQHILGIIRMEDDPNSSDLQRDRVAVEEAVI